MTPADAFKDGPYLVAALLCEKVLVERDGVKSAIRIVDRVNRTAAGLQPPDLMEPFDYELMLLISLKSGFARGPHRLRVEFVKPSQETVAPVDTTVNFEGDEDRGVDAVVVLKIRIDMTGIHWINVYLNDARLTRVPLRVVYTTQYLRRPGIPDGGLNRSDALKCPHG